MKQNILFILLVLLAAAGCKVGPDYKRPELATPDGYRFDSISTAADTILNLKWWEMFQDEELKALIDTALTYNQDVLAAASRIEEAMAVVGYTKADLWPNFGYNGSGSRQQLNLQGIAESPFNTFGANANVAWELDFWGKIRRSTEAARAELLASTYGRRAIQISLISAVASTYFQLLDYDARLEISKKTHNSRIESLRIIRERFEKGIAAEIDLNQAQIQEAIAASSIPAYERAVAQTENALNILLGTFPGSVNRTKSLTNEIAPPEIPAGIPSILLERRPDILEAEQRLAAQNARIGVAQAMRFPSFSLTGMLGVASSDLTSLVSGESLIWSLGGNFLGPIFNFGKNKRRVEIERQRMKQDSLYYVKTVLESFRDVEDALVEIKTFKNESVARNKQMVAADNAASLSNERYYGGVTSYLEVLDSERSQFNAQLVASETYRLYLESYLKLYKALGGGWLSTEEMNNATNNSTTK